MAQNLTLIYIFVELETIDLAKNEPRFITQIFSCDVANDDICGGSFNLFVVCLLDILIPN